MTVEKLCGILGCTVAAGDDGLKGEVAGGYCGDLLSRVMVGAQEGCAWITVMGNVNAVAVAAMTGAACILLAEDSKPDESALEKALQKGIVILQSGRTAYDLAVAVHEALADERA